MCLLVVLFERVWVLAIYVPFYIPCKSWWRLRVSNPWPLDCQSSALPTELSPPYELATPTGFEPVTAVVTGRCSTSELRSHYKNVGSRKNRSWALMLRLAIAFFNRRPYSLRSRIFHDVPGQHVRRGRIEKRDPDKKQGWLTSMVRFFERRCWFLKINAGRNLLVKLLSPANLRINGGHVRLGLNQNLPCQNVLRQGCSRQLSYTARVSLRCSTSELVRHCLGVDRGGSRTHTSANFLI